MTVAELPVALGSLNVRDTEGTKDGNAVTSANSSFESGDDENERGGAGVPMPMNESSSTRELSTADDRAPATEPKCYDTNAAVSSSASDSSSDETRLRAMHAAAALVHDDRLLEAKRLADQFFLFPPIAACSFYPTDPSPEDEQARSTLDSMLPAAERMVTFLESLKSNPHHGTGGTPNDADDEKDVANKQRAAPNSVPTNPPWQVQGEHMGKRDVSVYYRTDTATGAKLTARIESPIGTDMLVPLLSVLNESELYASWLPNWTVPRFRVRRSLKLAQKGRVSQVLLVTVDLPWPFSSRECVLDACGVDDIDANGDICVLVRAVDEDGGSGSDVTTGGTTGTPSNGTSSDETLKKQLGGIEIPSVQEPGTVRIGFEGGFLFRALPEEWRETKRAVKRDAEEKAKNSETSSSYTGWLTSGWGGSTGTSNKEDGGSNPGETPTQPGSASSAGSEEDHFEDAQGGDGGGAETAKTKEPQSRQILVSVQMHIDPKIDFVPVALMNFVTRTVLYTMWCMLLRVAEGVRDGKRPEHAAAIETKKHSLYDWTRARCADMFERVFSQEEMS